MMRHRSTMRNHVSRLEYLPPGDWLANDESEIKYERPSVCDESFDV